MPDEFSLDDWLDAPYYRMQCGETKLSRDLLENHYRTVGWKKGFDPHPFFSTEYYVLCYPETFTKDICPIDHFIYNSKKSDIPIVPSVFDHEFYAEQAGIADSKISDIVKHYCCSGSKRNLSPTALFAPSHYRRQVLPRSGTGNLFSEYIRHGWLKNLSPHPLFDPAHYGSSCDHSDGVPPLHHYIKKGWREGKSPHLLFDPEYYSMTCGYEIDGPPLLHYIKSKTAISAPHYLFSDAYYVSSAKSYLGDTYGVNLKPPPPLVHYIEHGAAKNIPTHPLFDSAHYRKSYERHLRARGGTSINPNWEIGVCLLQHYLTVGEKLGLSTSPFIDIDHLSVQLGMEPSDRVFRKYMMDGYEHVSPHPALDFDFFCETSADFSHGDVSIILHLLALPKENRSSPNPVFDIDFYLSDNDDVRENDLCPILHYLQYGYYEGRRPNAMFSHLYSHKKASRECPGFNDPVRTYFKLSYYRQPALVFLVHDASRTGAPLIALNLVREISKFQGIECYTILGAGGPLTDEFVKVSHTYILRERDRGFLDWFRHSSSFISEMKMVVDVIRNLPLVGILCNSLEARHKADYLSRLGFGPLITLIHEAADSYQSKQVLDTIAISDRVVFPSSYTMERSLKAGRFDLGKVAIHGQGLLTSGFGEGNREFAKEDVCRSLSIPKDAKIVLGCGSANKRKGIDLFVDAACLVLDQQTEAPPYFIWIGDGAAHHDSAYWWANRQIEECDYRNNIKLAGQKVDTEPYYLSADLFVLSSRIDPFPCVVHEAMASGLPIVAFEGASGSVEFAGASCRSVTMEARALASEIIDLLTDEGRRREMGEQAREIVRRNGDFRDYVSKIWDTVSAVSPYSAILPEYGIRSTLMRESIYFLSPDWQVSGVNSFTETIVSGLVKRGFDAKILFTRGVYTYKTDADAASFPQVPYEFLEPKSDRPDDVWEALTAFFLDKRQECVVVPNYDYIASSIFPALPPHVRFVGILHSDDDEHYEHGYRLGPYWDTIVCVSSFIREKLIYLNRSFEEKTRTINYGIPFDKQLSRKTLRKRLNGLRGRPLRLVYVGRLVEKQKRITNYIKLVRLLEKTNVNYELTFVGDGDMAAVLSAALSDLIETERVKMLGRLPPSEVREVVSQSDILLLLSDFEGLPLSVLEASSAGCVPVVWELDSGIPDLIRSGRNGFIVNKNDFNELVSVLSKLDADRDLLKTIARSTLTCFERSHFTDEFMVDEYEAVFLDVLSRSGQAKRLRPFTTFRGGATPPIWMRRGDE